ncbi:unnamed protein product [Fraxinus pennsylvanica]|uniref:Uncharacterized protein n=1 Tax=Fraxinus pennsylvanica TaxID=56036 RepID=A0AAD1ZXS8_9LAMI|nr:unnamed protein product [Fraxinus pennsylvanica]
METISSLFFQSRLFLLSSRSSRPTQTLQPARTQAWGGDATVNAVSRPWMVVYVPALAMGRGGLSLNREQKIKRRSALSCCHLSISFEYSLSDVYGWLFGNGMGNAVFLFRTQLSTENEKFWAHQSPLPSPSVLNWDGSHKFSDPQSLHVSTHGVELEEYSKCLIYLTSFDVV